MTVSTKGNRLVEDKKSISTLRNRKNLVGCNTDCSLSFSLYLSLYLSLLLYLSGVRRLKGTDELRKSSSRGSSSSKMSLV